MSSNIIRIIGGLIALLGIFVGLSLYISPATFVLNTDFTQPQIFFLAQMWAARQIAIAGVLGYGAIKNHRGFLLSGLVLYCVMNVQDAVIGLRMHDSGLVGGAVFFGMLTGVMAWRMTNVQTSSNK